MFSKILKLLFFSFSFIFFLYLIWPFEPKKISDFAPLPQSTKSELTGDTIEVPNVAAYFSDNYRDFATKYYRNQFQFMTKFPFPPLTLNHPPEYAFNYIKDQTLSTYLEEYVYPFRGSLFVNGLEPFDQKSKDQRYPGAARFSAGGMLYETKVTLRYYPTKVFDRILVWLGINLAVLLLYKFSKKIIYG
jgi:hypothetical protein